MFILTLISTCLVFKLNLISSLSFSTIGVYILFQLSFKGVYLKVNKEIHQN